MIYRVLRALGRIARGPREEDAMLSQGAPFRSHARHGILATALLLGLVLVLTTWTAWRDAEALAETVCEGQSEFFLRGLRAQTRQRRVTYADLLTIPGLGNRMLREFKEYRPYDGIERFRREIGTYVSKEEVARLERYVTVGK